jgi:hypothetical protein
MKVNKSKLQKLYQDYLLDTSSPSRQNCPDPEILLSCLRLEIPIKARKKVVDHISKCNDCAQEFKFIQGILQHEKTLIQQLTQALQNKKSPRGKRIYLIKNYPLPSWKFISVLATFFLVAVLVFSIILKFSKKYEYRGEQSSRINLISPNDSKYSVSALVFDWSEVPDAEYYVIEIFNDALSPMWKSNKIFANQTIPPSELIPLFEHNKTYFWMVQAFLADGEKLESRLQVFTVQK